MKPSATSISSLTPLRGIAALGVAAFHFQIYFIRFVAKEQSMFIDKGYLMVDLFFIMSGFLIMHVYKDEFAQKISAAAFKKFMLARFARIYPLHFFTLIIFLGVFYLGYLDVEGRYDQHAILSNLFLLHSFPVNKELTWNVPSWSISAEWWTYMLFPFFCLLLCKSRKPGIVIMLSGIVLLYTAILYFIPRHGADEPGYNLGHNLDVNFDYGFLRSIAGFMTGMLLYLLYSISRVRKMFSSDMLCGSYVALLLFAMHIGMEDIFFVPAYAILILLLTCNTGKISAGFNNRLFTFLGDISYSVYLIHFLLIIFIKMVAYKLGYHFNPGILFPFLQGAAFCLLYLLTLVGISAVSYRLLEKPCRKFINQKWAGK
ncbi:acyltransferase family protein [Ferruginibacter profundus]